MSKQKYIGYAELKVLHFLLFILLFSLFSFHFSLSSAQSLTLNQKGYLEKRGVNVMVYSNPFHAVFLDEKRSGIDVIHHGVMTITSQSVATHPSPSMMDAFWHKTDGS